MNLSNVNFIAVLVAAVVNMALGMAWYSPLLFGDVWAKAMGWSKKEIEKAKSKGMQKTYALAFASGFVMMYILALFVNLVSAKTIVNGATVGFLAWLGFAATTGFSTYLFEGRKFDAYFINASYTLFSLMIAGALLAVWV